MTDDLKSLSLGELIEKMIEIKFEHLTRLEDFKRVGREFVGTQSYEAGLRAINVKYRSKLEPYIDAIHYEVFDDPGHS